MAGTRNVAYVVSEALAKVDFGRITLEGSSERYCLGRQPLACHPILVVLLLFTLWQMHLAFFDVRRYPISSRSGHFPHLAPTYALSIILSILVGDRGILFNAYH
jgi:polyferredoxin